MTERADQFLRLYRQARVDDQDEYYDLRADEGERAHDQLLLASATVLALTSVAAFLAGLNITGKLAWAIAATILPTISSALAAYEGLYAFERYAKLFRDAQRKLLDIDPPELDAAADPAEATKLLTRYVAEVEGVFVSEQGQWGQLTGEIRAPAAPHG
jgi:hypothetical protein